MEINKNNFILIATDKNTKSNMGDNLVKIQICEDNEGKPGKAEKSSMGKGNPNIIAENFIRDGYDPSKIIINGAPAKDTIDLSAKNLKLIKRAPYQIGVFGYQKIGNFSEEEVAEMNKSKKLPDGLYLVFKPRINEYVNGMFTGSVPAQAIVNKLKDKNLARLNAMGIKYTNKIPAQYDIVNDNGKTYIKEKNTDIKEAKNDYKRKAIIISGIVTASIAAGIALISKFRK